MSKAIPANTAASVKQRLLNRAKAQKEDFNLLLTKYALERILYRISQSAHKEIFVLKGALLFELWTEQTHRPTRDADFLSQGENSLERFQKIFREICELKVADDGLRFDPASVKAERIKEDQDYEGIRVTFLGYLEAARLPVQIDIGFGDAITPAPVETPFPTLLEYPAPLLFAYPRETVVAEKFEALVKLGRANTRMKDFHDLRILASLFSFDSQALSEAIRRTFERRKTAVPIGALPTALTSEFYEDETKQKQWDAFISKNKLYIDPIPLREVIAAISSFVLPILPPPAPQDLPDLQWEPSGPWMAMPAHSTTTTE
ncbi:nucleotidyl transferase AbiEii/AbiGii toxin family protein [Granulicella sp. WH15]|uniref:nucleotidyl transferase AbiEii/AbiGii toxin family protein n=1 Tax=Granulicella sp. WH15 TaxID=2602070 RepID=UPI0013A59110|nr:nucleotidyl transferase AbiEii/AbiGii toxin family protein [Granulicella sp. WH15]